MMIALWMIAGGVAVAVSGGLLLRRRTLRVRAARALSQAATRISPFPISD
jgi:hypothetical protein